MAQDNKVKNFVENVARSIKAERERSLVVYFDGDEASGEVARELSSRLGSEAWELKTCARYSENPELRRARLKLEGNMHLYPILKSCPDLKGYDRVIAVTSEGQGYIASPVAQFLRLSDLCGKRVDVVTSASTKHAQMIDRQARELVGRGTESMRIVNVRESTAS